MSVCPICNSEVPAGSNYCTMCGNRLPDEAQTPPSQSSVYQNYYRPDPVPNAFDHTAEFDEKDIHENKLYAMLMYMLSLVGVFLAVLSAKDSPYVQFHLRQNLKLFVVEFLLAIVASVLAITMIIPVICAVGIVICVILRVIAFFQVCGNQAMEVPIIRALKFLN